MHSRPQSRTSSYHAELTRAIDDDTEVPEDLFQSLLKQAKEVRGRGQHVVVPKAQRNGGPPKLVHSTSSLLAARDKTSRLL